MRHFRSWHWQAIPLLLALAVSLLACERTSNPTPAPREPLLKWQAMASPAYGLHANLWLNPPTTERDLRLVEDAGFDWIKQRFEWRYLEAEKGNFQWERSDQIVQAANKLGLKIIARLDNQPAWATAPGVFPATSPPDNLQDFANYVFTIVDRYKAGSPYGHIDAYEIWNEPNLAREWGNRRPDASRYVEMLRLAYQAAKQADPNAIVISAGLSPTTASGDIATPDVEYLRQMYAAGARSYFDVLGVHAAGYKAPPELSPDEVAQDPRYNHNEGAAGRIYGFRHAEDLRQVMVANGDEQKQVAILEFGWTADDRPNSPYAWHAVSRQEQADYLVRAFQYAREHWQPWIGVMVALYVADPGWDPTMEQYYWSITQPNGRPWPAYDALKKMPK